MIPSLEFRQNVAAQLTAASRRVPTLTAFVGLDGFVDEILHVVDKRQSVTQYDRVRTIAAFAQRITGAAGQSTNIELVNVMTKLGGNGPIMANALASFGMKVSYLGSLGYPSLHPVFNELAQRAEVATLCGPGLTDALEFDDGKLMVGKHYTLGEVNWNNILTRFGREEFTARFASSDLVAFVNWTMLPFMSDIWESIQREILPSIRGARRKIFFDLADPEKRVHADIRRALELIRRFESHFDVILGLNEKEALEVSAVLGLSRTSDSPEGLTELSVEIQKRTGVNTLIVHPVSYALAVTAGKADLVEGPLCTHPKITTGAGDNFNSGFCLGKLLGLDNAAAVLAGCSASGHYVRTAHSPTLQDLAHLMQQWPTA
ncbi:MAG: hypothetical protein EXS36_09335 [Pedosphaera sp.]|nr:hypothetical protein [Pedosphaera sp.]